MDASGIKTELKSLRKDLNGFVNEYATLGAGLAVGAFAALSKGAMELAGNLADASANIGINVVSLQALQAQHKRNGVSNEELTKALEKTKAAVIAAAEGDIKAEAALAKLHLTSAKLIGLPLDKQYEAISIAVSKSKNEMEAYSAVSDILGAKVGPKLMGSMKELSETGLPGVTKAAQEAGQVMSTTTIAALDKAGDAIDDFKRKATIWAGEVVVNFRTEDGLKLIGLQLMSVLGKFGGGILDAIVEAGGMIGAVFKGAFIGVTNYFQDGLVSVVKGVAELINKVLPSRFEINVGNLDALKSSGQGIGDAITEAIAKTSPSTFKKDFGESWDSAIKAQQVVVDKLNKADFKDGIAALEKVINTPIKPPVIPPIPPVQADIPSFAKVAQMLSSAIERTGMSYRDQSTTALKGVRERVSSQLQSAELADRQDFASVGKTTESFATSAFKSELYNIDRELEARRQFAADFSRIGEDKTLAKYGDANFQRYSKEMQDTSTRTTNAIEQIARGLTGAGIIKANT